MCTPKVPGYLNRCKQTIYLGSFIILSVANQDCTDTTTLLGPC